MGRRRGRAGPGARGQIRVEPQWPQCLQANSRRRSCASGRSRGVTLGRAGAGAGTWLCGGGDMGVCAATGAGTWLCGGGDMGICAATGADALAGACPRGVRVRGRTHVRVHRRLRGRSPARCFRERWASSGRPHFHAVAQFGDGLGEVGHFLFEPHKQVGRHDHGKPAAG
jgi:hypothetical protein